MNGKISAFLVMKEYKTTNRFSHLGEKRFVLNSIIALRAIQLLTLPKDQSNL